MADVVFNIAKGRFVELANRVNSNDPTNAAFVVVAIDTAATDATLIDLDTLALVLADASTAEVTNTNYARKTIADGGDITVTIDDANNRTDVDIPDQTWTTIAAGDDWTDLVICYDSDTTAGDDTNIVPLSLHDFETTPDGTDLTAQINASGILRAA